MLPLYHKAGENPSKIKGFRQFGELLAVQYQALTSASRTAAR